ncbi:MAG: DUF4870 domain-containing protein [Candidatus Velthaea sp.]
MDCYYHHAVPSVALCTGCKQPICATCRSEQGDCPGCRLAARLDAAAHSRELPGRVPPRPERETHAPPPRSEAYAAQRPRTTAVAIRPESRALAALGYPFWPLAVLALLDSSRSPFLKRQALQALGFNFGMYGLALMLSAVASIPFIGISAWPLLPFVIPVTIVASIVYGFKAWHGEDVRVPIVSDFLDDKIAA